MDLVNRTAQGARRCRSLMCLTWVVRYVSSNDSARGRAAASTHQTNSKSMRMLIVADASETAPSLSALSPTGRRQDRASSADRSVRSDTATGSSGTRAWRIIHRACSPTTKHPSRRFTLTAGTASHTCSNENGWELASNPRQTQSDVTTR